MQIENHSSPNSSTNIGVPQGSVLGPIFFLIYTEDLTHTSNLKVTFNAHDSVLSLVYKKLAYCKKVKTKT